MTLKNGSIKDDELLERHLIRSGAFGILIVGATLALCGADQCAKSSLISRTREQAESLAKKPCKPESFADSHGLIVSERTHVDYQCEGVAVACGRHPSSQKYECAKK